MFGKSFRRNGFVIMCVLCALLLLPVTSSAQTGTAAARESSVDLECQLHLLVASNGAAGEGGRLTAPLDAIARELRPLLPFANYRLGATFLSRVKSGRPLNVKGVGRTLLVTPALESSPNPTFYDFSAGAVTLQPGAGGREMVQMAPFRFGLRIPLHTGPIRTGVGNEETVTVNYESVGITTDVTMAVGEPVVVGTLDVGRPNETLVLVLLVRRASTR